MTNKAKTLGELKKSGYVAKSIKQELRDNLITKLRSGERVFEGILGFDNTVLPDIERAILSRHNILLLGLRGQAKTRIARLMTGLLDEYIPVVKGSEINDDPLQPLSIAAVNTIEENGDNTPIEWVHRNERYVEKLATPDVSVADLIGDVDPIKAATLKLPYSDERVIHFGLVPRAHRSIFVLNELPDLQARIQVSLFNILQEGDLQIRGFKLRFPLDIQFVFTANPEDYTNRGSIVTPLKDRIESQILTHYPINLDIAKTITAQEAKILPEQNKRVIVSNYIRTLIEMISFEARESEFIDENSGISARMSIAALENIISTAERRCIMSGTKSTSVRVTDIWGVVPSITGKVELVYEGEQEGPYAVALSLIDKALKEMFLDIFPNPEKSSADVDRDPYGAIRAWFSDGNSIELFNEDTDQEYKGKLDSIAGLSKVVDSYTNAKDSKYLLMEVVLHGLSGFKILGKNAVANHTKFNDPLANIIGDLTSDDYEEDLDDQ